MLSLLSPEPSNPKGGKPSVCNCADLADIVYVLKIGVPRAMLPKEPGCSSSVTCWRKLRYWQGAGVWQQRLR